MKVPFFLPWITKNDKKYLNKALDQQWLTNGPTLKKFEEKFQKYVGTKYAIGVGNGTQALHLAVRSIGIGYGDEVIVPTFTFAATANAVSHCGASPVLTDVDLQTFNITASHIKKKITKKTKAVIVVHYGGQACDMTEILSLTRNHGLYLIEDCAHSLGSVYQKKKCGTIGNIACFSFYPTKIITTGEGGMINTSDPELAQKMRLLRSHGMTISSRERETAAQWKYDIVDLGYNYRLDELRASLGLSQLDRIDQINKMRLKIAIIYNNLIKKIKGLSIPYVAPNRNHIYHLYTIKVEKEYHLNRDELFQRLNEKGIGASVQYYPLHLMSYNKGKFRQKDFVNSNILKNQVLSLPLFPTMTMKQVEYVVAALR